MALTAEKLAEEALSLPAGGRALLIEKLLASLAGETNSTIERAHLDEVCERRTAAQPGKTGFVDGVEALNKARAALKK